MAGYAPVVPMSRDPNDGFSLLSTLKQVAIQNVRMVLYTEPGERVGDLDFGVGLRRYLFEQNILSTHEQLKLRIRNQLSKYLPYINIINLDIYAVDQNNNIVGDGNSNFMKLVLLFNIAGSGEIIPLEAYLAAAAGETGVGPSPEEFET